MTHISEQSSTDEQQLKDNLSQIKTEGSTRLSRIAQILRTAFAESATELKAGANTVSPAAKDVKESVTQLIQETGRETMAEAKHVWANRSSRPKGWRDWLRTEIKAAIRAMKATLSEKRHSGKISDRAIRPTKIDSALDENVQGDS